MCCFRQGISNLFRASRTRIVEGSRSPRAPLSGRRFPEPMTRSSHGTSRPPDGPPGSPCDALSFPHDTRDREPLRTPAGFSDSLWPPATFNGTIPFHRRPRSMKEARRTLSQAALAQGHTLAWKPDTGDRELCPSVAVTPRPAARFREQLPNHRHRNLKAFAEHMQIHVSSCFFTELYLYSFLG